jgi:hypothetical protein
MLIRLPILVGVLLTATTSGASLQHEAYVWQRIWNAPVHDAVSTAATVLDGFVVLAAEVTTAQTIRVTLDNVALRATGKPYGLALRVGPAALVTPEFATAILAGSGAAELQIDFDCAESKLDSYRHWLTAIRAKVVPTPVTITVLPAWLRQPAFSNLVAATDGFVLQVHSFDSTLCDTGRAVQAVAQAARYGVPFRIALPTYGYVVAHDRAGKFIGLAAEGPARDWPIDAVITEVRADAPALAALVQDWDAHRPANCRGILWYRLPIASDKLNWRWSTLAAIVAGQIPQPALTAVFRHPQPGLVELDLLNTGTADVFTSTTVTVLWRDATLLACDALAGFAITGPATNVARFVGNPRLSPGERRVAGWLRFRETEEVCCEIKWE